MKVQSKERWRVGRRGAGPDWTRRFIRGASRGCKVRVQPGIHHRPSREGQTGATRQGRRGSPDGRDSGQLENPPHGNAEGHRLQGNLKFSPSASQGAEDAGKLADSALAKPEGAKPGATREAASRCRKVLGRGATHPKNHRRYRRTVRRGNPTQGQSAPPKDASDGATRNSIAGKAGDARAGKLADASQALQGGVRKRGDPPNHLNRQRGQIRNPKHSGNGVTRTRGNPESRATWCRTAGTAKWTEEAGQPVESSPARMERAEPGQPRAANSPSRKMQEPGQLGASSTG